MIKKWIDEQMIKSKRTTGFDSGTMLVWLRPQSCLLICITETVEGNLGSQQGLVYRRRWDGNEVFSSTTQLGTNGFTNHFKAISYATIG